VFRALGFHAHATGAEGECLGQALGHLGQKWAEPRGLADHGGVDVHEMRSLRDEKVHDCPEQDEARHACIAGVRIREVAAQVAEGEGSEQRLTDRMGEDVGVGVAAQAAPARDGHAAEHQRASVHQRMEIEAEAGARHAGPRPARRPSHWRAVSRSSGVVILRFR
jgi:hypothetical protein